MGVGVDQGTPTLQLVLFHSDFSIFLISEIFRVGKCWEDMKSPLFSCVVIKSTKGSDKREKGVHPPAYPHGLLCFSVAVTKSHAHPCL